VRSLTFFEPSNESSDLLFSTCIETADTNHYLMMSLPLPPTGPVFNQSNLGDQVHNNWMPLVVHTAKCDLCNQHNRDVLQRCTLCNRQMCKKCITDNADGKHFADHAGLDWNPASVSKPPHGRKSGSKKQSTKKAAGASPSLSNIASLSQVTKARFATARNIAASRLSSSVQAIAPPTQLSLPETSLFVNQQTKSYQEDDDFGGGFTTEEDPIDQSEVTTDYYQIRAQYSQSRGRTGVYVGAGFHSSPRENIATTSDSGLGSDMWTASATAPVSRPGISHSHLNTLTTAASGMPFFRRSAISPEATTTTLTTTTNSKGADDVPYSIPYLLDDDHLDFGQVLAKIQEVKRAEKEQLQQQAAIKAKRDAFEFEASVAWDLDPTIKVLRDQGLDDEAREMFEQACILMKCRRGID
jgi:hypothetical protein